MTTVFVTGGSGFVGRNLIRGLLAKGYSVKALARSAASAEVVERLGAKPVRGDVLDGTALVQGMQGCERLIHAAADTNHAVDVDPAQDRINVEGTRTVMRSAQHANVARAVHVSTESVLADGRPIHMARETWPYPARHAGGYSRTKAQAERAALEQANDRFVVCAIRPRFVWGRDDTSALPQLVRAAHDGRLQWIDGGNYLTSTAHIDNVVAGALLALEHGRAGETYFLSDGAPVSFRAFVSDLLLTQGVEPPTKSVPRWLVKPMVAIMDATNRISSGRLRPLMSRQEYATVGHEVTIDDTKARRELGYTPVTTIEQGLEELRAVQAGRNP